MLDTRIILLGLLVATMFTFLWGDILGLISGDTIPGEIDGAVYKPTHIIWVGMHGIGQFRVYD
jgi:hypothetical protein